MTTTPNTTITPKKATAVQPSPPQRLERVSGADEACMLDTVNLFPQIHTFNLNRHRKSCNPDIENIAYFRSALLSQNKCA
jgi:hypothetical protein